MIYCLEQLLTVSKKFADDPDYLAVPEEPDHYWVRTAEKADDTLIWQDTLLPVPPPRKEPLIAHVDDTLLFKINALPSKSVIGELDFFMFPRPFREGQARPQYPYLLIMIDSQKGMPLVHDLVNITTSQHELLPQLPELLFKKLISLKFAPKEIKVASPQLAEILKPHLNKVNIKLTEVALLPLLENMKIELSMMI